MKQTIYDHQLKDITVPTVELSQHQAKLRHVLVSQAAQRADPKIPFLQGVMSLMSKRTLFTGAGVASVLALAVVTFSSFSTPPASAMQLAQNSAKALQAVGFTAEDVAGLSEQEITYKKYSPQFAYWLEAAQHADDLRVLSDEDAQTYITAPEGCGPDHLCVIDNPTDGQAPDAHKLTYMAFTLTEGQAKTYVIIGINEQNVPEASFIQVITPGKASA